MTSNTSHLNDSTPNSLSLLHHNSPEKIGNDEIDLLSLLDILFKNKKKIISATVISALLGVLYTFIAPKVWTSQSIVTPAENVQWQVLNEKLTSVVALDITPEIEQDGVFNLFIKKIKSRDEFEKYLLTTDYLKNKVAQKKVNNAEMHKLIAQISEKMSAQNNAADKKDETVPFTSWTLRFSAETPDEARNLLQGYINYISGLVVKETLEGLQLRIKNRSEVEKKKLALDRIRLKNVLETNIQRLNYSLEIANAAGIKHPAYSNGQTIKDDPDYSIALGANGISKKLQIQKSITDLSSIDHEILNRTFNIKELDEINVADVSFQPFMYQAAPSLPVSPDGPRKALIVLLAAMLGGMLSCGYVLLRNALSSRQNIAS